MRQAILCVQARVEPPVEGAGAPALGLVTCGDAGLLVCDPKAQQRPPTAIRPAVQYAPSVIDDRGRTSRVAATFGAPRRLRWPPWHCGVAEARGDEVERRTLARPAGRRDAARGDAFDAIAQPAPHRGSVTDMGWQHGVH